MKFAGLDVANAMSTLMLCARYRKSPTVLLYCLCSILLRGSAVLSMSKSELLGRGLCAGLRVPY